tara:strand:+ start:1365 stop:1613 length:249 start_codon:yes stop_codon:yes gene_type:complete
LADSSKIYTDYFDGLDKIREKIAEDSEVILSIVDPQKLLLDPAKYLSELGRLFFEAHKKEMKKSIHVGTKKAKRVLDEIKES